jgi:hypothetical protein
LVVDTCFLLSMHSATCNQSKSATSHLFYWLEQPERQMGLCWTRLHHWVACLSPAFQSHPSV